MILDRMERSYGGAVVILDRLDHYHVTGAPDWNDSGNESDRFENVHS